MVDINAVNMAVQTVLRKIKSPTSDIGSVLAGTFVVAYKPEAYGAKGDGVTDDGPAVQAMLDAMDAAAQRGGKAVLGAKTYLTNQPLAHGQYSRLVGDSRNATVIKAGPSFPMNQPIITTGKPGVLGAIFGSRIEDVTFDCNHRAAGWYTRRANEQSGLRNAQIRNAMLYTAKMDNESGDGGQPAQGYVLEHIEGNMSLTNTTGAGMWVLGAPGPRKIDDVTINSGDGATQMAAGIPAFLLDGMQGLVSNIHPEHFDLGVKVGETRGCSGIAIDGVGGHSSVPTLIQITTGLTTVAFSLRNLRRGGSVTTVDDQPNGNVLTHDFIPMYLSGGGVTGSQTILSTETGIKQRFANGFQSLGAVAEFIRAANSHQTQLWKVTTNANNNFEGYANGDMKWGTGGSATSATTGFAAPSVWGAKTATALRLDQFTTTARNTLSTGWSAPNKTAAIGAVVHDTTLGKPVMWDGTVWKDFAGTTV